jgi:hypothetical protein
MTNVIFEIYFGIGMFVGMSFLAMMTCDIPIDDEQIRLKVFYAKMGYEMLPNDERMMMFLRVITLWPFLPFLKAK